MYLKYSVVNRLHGWEEKNILDAVGVRHQHGQSVNTDTPTSSRWETVLKRSDEVSVNGLSLIISHLLGYGLILESLKLYLGVVQFSVGVDDFVIVDEQLKSLRETLS